MQTVSPARRVALLALTVVLFQAAGVAVVGGAFLGKRRGYFYSTSQRVALFDKLPDPSAAHMLSLIYSDQPQIPEMTLVRYSLQPKTEEQALQELRKDPRWTEAVARVGVLQFDPAMAELTSHWSLAAFEKLLTDTDQGRALSPTQRKRLDTGRENALKAMLKVVPQDDAQTRQLCSQAETLLNRPWRLKRSWYAFIQGATGQQQDYVLKELVSTSEPARQLSLLRQVRLLAKIGNLESANYHRVGPLTLRAQENVRAGRQTEHNLRLLAQYQKLAHWVKKSNEKLRLTPEQKKILDTDPWQ